MDACKSFDRTKLHESGRQEAGLASPCPIRISSETVCHLCKRSHIAYKAGGTNCSEYSHSFGGCCRKWPSARLAGHAFTDQVCAQLQSRNAHGRTHTNSNSVATLGGQKIICCHLVICPNIAAGSISSVASLWL